MAKLEYLCAERIKSIDTENYLNVHDGVEISADSVCKCLALRKHARINAIKSNNIVAFPMQTQYNDNECNKIVLHRVYFFFMHL